ncbi:hypothetical protein KEM54_000466, partial [Ascosphaera aggregata]
MALPPQQPRTPQEQDNTSPDRNSILLPVSAPPSENPSLQSTPAGSPAQTPYVLSPRSSFIGSRHRATGSGDLRPRSMNHVKFTDDAREIDDHHYSPPRPSALGLNATSPSASAVGASVNPYHHVRHSTASVGRPYRAPSPTGYSVTSTGRSVVSGEPSPPQPAPTDLQDESMQRLVQSSSTPLPPEVPEDEFELDDGGDRNALDRAQQRARRLASMVYKPTIQRRRLGRESFKLPNLPKLIYKKEVQSAPPAQSEAPKDSFTAASTTVTPENEFEDSGHYAEKIAKHRSVSAKTTEAHNLVKHLTRHDFEPISRVYSRHDAPQTPYEEQGEDYVERPRQYRGGILATLLKLYETQRSHEDPVTRGRTSPGSESPSRPRTAFSPHWRPGQHPHSRTPSRPRWYEKNMSTASIPGTSTPAPPSPQLRPGLGPRSHSSGGLAGMAKKFLPRQGRLEDEIRIT